MCVCVYSSILTPLVYLTLSIKSLSLVSFEKEGFSFSIVTIYLFSFNCCKYLSLEHIFSWLFRFSFVQLCCCCCCYLENVHWVHFAFDCLYGNPSPTHTAKHFPIFWIMSIEQQFPSAITFHSVKLEFL